MAQEGCDSSGVLPSPADGSRDPGEAASDLLGVNAGAEPSAACRSMRGDSAEQRSLSRRSGCASLMGENKTRALGHCLPFKWPNVGRWRPLRGGRGQGNVKTADFGLLFIHVRSRGGLASQPPAKLPRLEEILAEGLPGHGWVQGV